VGTLALTSTKSDAISFYQDLLENIYEALISPHS